MKYKAIYKFNRFGINYQTTGEISCMDFFTLIIYRRVDQVAIIKIFNKPIFKKVGNKFSILGIVFTYGK